ncbi:hypothetical protein LJ737_02720 [Hymenobacter sp. 15J16-1T3B]|uniref:hypothetical protein n=1 Tax=Hymenobacter sp. 15J16-1T3B TaxID=2886941 RepID=UPI001D101E10|nr:hypothetical protein [Hymenobacter sp. 15J16-1T3B]MCC3156130.1 hypothetical protein [Hymenobacter sp. 15J16-1T3B]
MSHSNSKGNEPSKQQPGGPAAAEQPKAAGQLPVNNRDEQTEDRLEQEAQDAPQRHPNRNLEKPELDKPSYGGGH